jgi:hypothetical protein
MSERVLLARLDYVGSACCFALVAAASTRLRDTWDLWIPLTVVLPTALAAIAASLKLVRPNGVAAPTTWLIAGVVVPMVAVIGFMEANFLGTYIASGHTGPRANYWFAVVVGSMVTVPVGLLGHLVLRWVIGRRWR